MNITPLEIRQKNFEKGFRGYEKEAVDAFLKSLASEWERMISENKTLQVRVESMEKDVIKLREVESSLYKALKTAEDTKQEMINQAQRSAELVLKEAKMQANGIINDARQKAKTLIEDTEIAVKEVNGELKEQLIQFEADYSNLERQRDNILMELRAIGSDIMERVQKYANRKTSLEFDPIFQNLGMLQNKEADLKDVKKHNDKRTEAIQNSPIIEKEIFNVEDKFVYQEPKLEIKETPKPDIIIEDRASLVFEDDNILENNTIEIELDNQSIPVFIDSSEDEIITSTFEAPQPEEVIISSSINTETPKEEEEEQPSYNFEIPTPEITVEIPTVTPTPVEIAPEPIIPIVATPEPIPIVDEPIIEQEEKIVHHIDFQNDDNDFEAVDFEAEIANQLQNSDATPIEVEEEITQSFAEVVEFEINTSFHNTQDEEVEIEIPSNAETLTDEDINELEENESVFDESEMELPKSIETPTPTVQTPPPTQTPTNPEPPKRSGSFFDF